MAFKLAGELIRINLVAMLKLKSHIANDCVVI